jgi:hypothetical protein
MFHHSFGDGVSLCAVLLPMFFDLETRVCGEPAVIKSTMTMVAERKLAAEQEVSSSTVNAVCSSRQINAGTNAEKRSSRSPFIDERLARDVDLRKQSKALEYSCLLKRQKREKNKAEDSDQNCYTGKIFVAILAKWVYVFTMYITGLLASAYGSLRYNTL